MDRRTDGLNGWMERHVEVWLKIDNSTLGTLTTNTEGDYSPGDSSKSSFEDI